MTNHSARRTPRRARHYLNRLTAPNEIKVQARDVASRTGVEFPLERYLDLRLM